jgi:hypothetical protein
MPDEPTAGPQQQLPPLKETRWVNVQIAVGDADDSGARELTFVTGPLELTTYVLPPDAQEYIAKQFSGGIDIVPASALPPSPSQE